MPDAQPHRPIHRIAAEVLAWRGCTVVSVKESWLNGSPEVQDILVAFAGWQAQMETPAALRADEDRPRRRKAEGKPVGRQPGAKDKTPRKRSGYVRLWEEGGARGRAQVSGL